MGDLLEIIGGVFLVLGSITMLLAAIGMYRMPDFYNRIQVATKASTLGLLQVALGVGLIMPGWAPKLVVLFVFILFTNPISSHLVARAAYFTKVPMSKDTKIDKLKESISKAHLKTVKTKA
ncbi:MAG: monovalent cation/H(+) antiporter subunit G [Ichthyobacteriaceae bacterium]|nr:monovalent cation/H(+) antiporter subunit G [Ichthyobacteriaceae bacterium]